MLAIRDARLNQTKLPNKRKKKRRGFNTFLSKHKKEELIDLICMLSREYGLREEIEQYFEENDWDEE